MNKNDQIKADEAYALQLQKELNSGSGSGGGGGLLSRKSKSFLNLCCFVLCLKYLPHLLFYF